MGVSLNRSCLPPRRQCRFCACAFMAMRCMRMPWNVIQMPKMPTTTFKTLTTVSNVAHALAPDEGAWAEGFGALGAVEGKERCDDMVTDRERCGSR